MFKVLVMKVVKQTVILLSVSFLVFPCVSSAADIQFTTTPFSFKLAEGNSSVFENANFQFTSKRDAISFHFSGRSLQEWGNMSGEKSSTLDFAYLGIRSQTGRTDFRVGRFHLSEGIAAEWMNGLSSRTQLSNNMYFSLFAGNPVDSPEINLAGGKFSFGIPNRYTIGISYLKEGVKNEDFREETGMDIRFQPYRKVEVYGRSRFNLESDQWMEHSYYARVGPFQKLTFTADASLIDYSAFSNSLVPRAYSSSTVGGGVGYPFSKGLMVKLDLRRADDPMAGTTLSKGLNLTYTSPHNWKAAFLVNSREGENPGMDRIEAGTNISKKTGNLEAFLNLQNVFFNTNISSAKNFSSATLGLNYEVSPFYRIAADIQNTKYESSDPDFRGFVKLEYRFKT